MSHLACTCTKWACQLSEVTPAGRKAVSSVSVQQQQPGLSVTDPHQDTDSLFPDLRAQAGQVFGVCSTIATVAYPDDSFALRACRLAVAFAFLSKGLSYTLNLRTPLKGVTPAALQAWIACSDASKLHRLQSGSRLPAKGNQHVDTDLRFGAAHTGHS